MKEIKLSQGEVALVNDEDYIFLNQWKWYADRHSNTFYAATKINSKKCYMHRIILNATKNVIDHRDGNGLNNQRNNIRSCSQSENLRNQKKVKGISKYKGVFFSRASNKWTSQIKIDDKKIHLGLFGSEIDAAFAYNQAAKKHFGEFANINIV
jgi:hypothetical protein